MMQKKNINGLSPKKREFEAVQGIKNLILGQK
jgi:hypothetical protein